jgi:hypothetical protein
MDRVALICVRMEQLSEILPGENVEFDSDGSVHIVRGWKRWARRKVSLGGDRKTLASDLLALLELSNDVASGLLGAPRVRCDCLDIGVHGRANKDDEGSDDEKSNYTAETAENSAFASATIVDAEGNITLMSSKTEEALRGQFFAQCDTRKREALQRLAGGLQGVCKAINTLMTSTYVDDCDTCGSLMKLINYATLQRQRIEDILKV